MRKPARRSQCTNNLKQLSLALHNYHDKANTFPAGYYPTAGNSNLGGGASGGCGCGVTGSNCPRWSTGVYVEILPYIEQGAVYNQWNFSIPWRIGTNWALCQSGSYNGVSGVRLNAYICPSDKLQAQWNQNNYAISMGPNTGFQNNGIMSNNGMFQWLTQTRMADVTDGLSNTIMMAEVLSGSGNTNRTGMDTLSDIIGGVAMPSGITAATEFPDNMPNGTVAGLVAAVTQWGQAGAAAWTPATSFRVVHANPGRTPRCTSTNWLHPIGSIQTLAPMVLIMALVVSAGFAAMQCILPAAITRAA